MYIEFKLEEPSAGFANRRIVSALHEWSDRYNIPYNTKLHKYMRRVTFDDDTHYTLFSMTWNPKNQRFLDKWRIVSDLNNKIEFDSRV